MSCEDGVNLAVAKFPTEIISNLGLDLLGMHCMAGCWVGMSARASTLHQYI